MAGILAILFILLTIFYIFTLQRNAINTFIAGAVYQWFREHDKDSAILPQMTMNVISTTGFSLAKNLSILLTITWLGACVFYGQWVYLMAAPIGFILAIMVIKFTHSKFNTRDVIVKAGRVVRAKRLQLVGQLSANDIAQNSYKNQISNLDFLLENEDFIKFAQKLKDRHSA